MADTADLALSMVLIRKLRKTNLHTILSVDLIYAEIHTILSVTAITVDMPLADTERQQLAAFYPQVNAL